MSYICWAHLHTQWLLKNESGAKARECVKAIFDLNYLLKERTFTLMALHRREFNSITQHNIARMYVCVCDLDFDSYQEMIHRSISTYTTFNRKHWFTIFLCTILDYQSRLLHAVKYLYGHSRNHARNHFQNKTFK